MYFISLFCHRLVGRQFLCYIKCVFCDGHFCGFASDCASSRALFVLFMMPLHLFVQGHIPIPNSKPCHRQFVFFDWMSTAPSLGCAQQVLRSICACIHRQTGCMTVSGIICVVPLVLVHFHTVYNQFFLQGLSSPLCLLAHTFCTQDHIRYKHGTDAA